MKKLIDFSLTQPSTPSAKMLSVINTLLSAIQQFFVAMLCLAALALWCYAPVGVDGSSMQNSFMDGETVIVRKLAALPKRGEVVVVEKDGGGYLIKRVVAVGGDEIGFVSGVDGTVELYLNDGNGFERVSEPYIKEAMKYADSVFVKLKPYNSEAELIANGGFRIPQDGLYILGDNRNHSADSRSYGIFYEESVYGVVVAKDEDSKILSALFSLFYNESEIEKTKGD